MNAKTNNRTLVTVLPLLGLVLLVLLSPCKVRNYLQAELGLAQTKVTNKSQTTTNVSHCSSYVAALHTFAKQKNSPQPYPLATVAFNFVARQFNSRYVPLYKAKKSTTTSIPLYILYQNFKDYL